MKQKEKQGYRSQKKADLAKEIAELKSALVKHKVNRYTKPSKNARMGKMMRQKIAILSTIQRELELFEEEK